MSRSFGYIRVSSTDQNEDRQVLAMAAAGVAPENVFLDKFSGKDFYRPRYVALLETLAPGDILHITSIDRLGRDYAEVREQWRLLTREKKVDMVVLDMPLLNTGRHKDLLGTFIADLVLQVLSFVAHHERDAIRRRQAEGIAAARLRGVRFGRPPKPLPDDFETVVALWKRGNITTSEAARRAHCARSTFRKKAEGFLESAVRPDAT